MSTNYFSNTLQWYICEYFRPQKFPILQCSVLVQLLLDTYSLKLLFKKFHSYCRWKFASHRVLIIASLQPIKMQQLHTVLTLTRLRLTFFRVLLSLPSIIYSWGICFCYICKSVVRPEPYFTGQLVKMPHHPHPSATCFPLLPQPPLTTLPMPLPVYRSSMYR